MRRMLCVLGLLALASTAWAQDSGGMKPRGPAQHGGPFMGAGGPGMRGPMGPGGPSFERFLYPPELVLTNQAAIGLSETQLQSVKQSLNETHARVLDLQVELHAVTERLTKILEPDRVDEAAALAAVNDAMALESQIKRAHLTLLVKVKNVLSPEQQAKLRELRPEPAQPR